MQRRNRQLRPAQHSTKRHLQIREPIRGQNSLCNLIEKTNTVQSMLIRLSIAISIIHTSKIT